MAEVNSVGKLAVFYAKYPTIAALAKLVPGGSSFDTLIQRRANEIKDARSYEFFEELADGRIELTDEIVATENFIHAFECTMRSGLRARQRRKTRMFARILTASADPATALPVDQVEELVSTLEALSEREFALLVKLRGFERTNQRGEKENELQWVSRYWIEFSKEAQEQYNVDQDTFRALMSRMQRTGLYQEITGIFFDYEGGLGMTTPLLEDLLAIVTGPELQTTV